MTAILLRPDKSSFPYLFADSVIGWIPTVRKLPKDRAEPDASSPRQARGSEEFEVSLTSCNSVHIRPFLVVDSKPCLGA